MKRFFHLGSYLVVFPGADRKSIAVPDLRRLDRVLKREAAEMPSGNTIEVWYDAWDEDEAQLHTVYTVKRGKPVMNYPLPKMRRNAPGNFPVSKCDACEEAVAEYGWPDDGVPILCRRCWLHSHSPGNFVYVGEDGSKWDVEKFEATGAGSVGRRP